VRRALAPALLLLAALAAEASDTGLSGMEGHPRGRLPLAVWLGPLGEAPLDAAARRAVEDWNTVAGPALGAAAFVPAGRQESAQILVTFEPPGTHRLMGETHVRSDAGGVIGLPVRIVVYTPGAARGETSRATLLYQVLAHELGHALGLEHVTDPRSLMCCVRGSVDFSDPAARQAYVDARRHPDVGSVRAQLEAHYRRFWRAPGGGGG